MNPKFLLTISVLFLAANVFAQSGRVKPTETPVPSPTPRRVVYSPTEPKTENPLPSPTPQKAPKNSTNDDETITFEANLVPVPVSVLDAKGVSVTNLKLDDFLLQVDGQTVGIGDVTRSETPVRLALLFDNSSSVSIAREFEKKAAIKFFRQVIRPEKDLVALFSVATGVRLEQPLTKNVGQLTNAIELFPNPEGATALLDGIIKAAEYLRDAQGRRVVVIVSDGDDTVSDSTLEQTMRALQVTNCQVYVVKTTDFENFKRTGQRGGNANIRQLSAERRMQEIAAQTGGAVYSPIDEDELERAFAQISAELSQQYILSYYPDDDADKRGQFRTISLTVKNRPNLSVRTRKGYYVPKHVK